MNVLRTENRVPEVYVNHSRDFQLLCRLYNIVLNGCKFNISNLRYANNPRFCQESYLNLLADKYGFEYESNIYSDLLRIILDSFKQIVMYKGSIKGIKEAINCFMYVIQIDFDYQVILNELNEVEIRIYHVPFDTSMLTDILKYVLPTGCFIKYYFITIETTVKSELKLKEEMDISIVGISNQTPISNLVFANNTKFSENTMSNIKNKMLINSANTTAVMHMKSENNKESDYITTAYIQEFSESNKESSKEEETV